MSRPRGQRLLWKPTPGARGAAPVTAERDVQATCIQWLNTLPGVSVWRQNRGAFAASYTNKSGFTKKRFVRFGIPGQSDSTGSARGIRVDIEFKRPGEVPDFDQDSYLRMISDGGGIAFWCDSLEMCQNKLEAEFIRRCWEWRETWRVQ